MCGIVGYGGGRQAYPILVKGLTRLEYRGYDSAGVALVNDNGDSAVAVLKRVNPKIAIMEQRRQFDGGELAFSLRFIVPVNEVGHQGCRFLQIFHLGFSYNLSE